ncbi:hypothetical protein EJP69_25855 [Variovorax gossypii]|uniref:Uncharacterized protein n=1 Tax=Variovorax gossypii TaxID=1679495 RepID=A0A3S0GSJ0_9BURK|nr:hypothetical protein EJP69_25855 [Variovorax gossypii]
MLISLQRFDGAGRGAAAASLCTGGGADGGGATGCGRVLATTGFGLDGASSALSAFSAFSAFSALPAPGGSARSRGTFADRHGVRHGLASAASAARRGRPCSAITVATTAIARRGEERAG